MGRYEQLVLYHSSRSAVSNFKGAPHSIEWIRVRRFMSWHSLLPDEEEKQFRAGHFEVFIPRDKPRLSQRHAYIPRQYTKTKRNRHKA